MITKQRYNFRQIFLVLIVLTTTILSRGMLLILRRKVMITK